MKDDRARLVAQTSQYLDKHQLFAAQLACKPDPSLELIVIIPCYDEPNLLLTLESLWHCRAPDCAVEVLIVINDSASCHASVSRRNRQCLNLARQWCELHQRPGLRFWPLYYAALPARHAGVGLARKLGMDEAVARLRESDKKQGVLVCLDADCTVQSNYLDVLWRYFQTHSEVNAASIYFEHAIPSSPQEQAIVAYELHLRYYVQSLRRAGFSAAFHTLGSCLALRSQVYARQGGMNRRQAGEDFYFVQKLIPLGGYTDITRTTVYPSARASHRVPFGTGKAVREFCHGGIATYAPEIFRDLALFLAQVDGLVDIAARHVLQDNHIPECVRVYLESIDFAKNLAEIQCHSASLGSFRKRFFRYFNPFRVMKFVRQASLTHYPMVAVEQAAAYHLRVFHGQPEVDGLVSLLAQFRHIDKSQGDHC